MFYMLNIWFNFTFLSLFINVAFCKKYGRLDRSLLIKWCWVLQNMGDIRLLVIKCDWNEYRSNRKNSHLLEVFCIFACKCGFPAVKIDNLYAFSWGIQFDYTIDVIIFQSFHGWWFCRRKSEKACSLKAFWFSIRDIIYVESTS